MIDEIVNFCYLPFIAFSIVFFFGVTLYCVLPWLSEQISLIGLYHNAKNYEINERFQKIAAAYFKVSIPLLVSYILILQSLQISIDLIISFIVIATTMTTLLVIRIHGNPGKNAIRIKNKFQISKQYEIVEQHRERILSFIFSLIAAQVVIGLLSFGYGVYQGNSYSFNFDLGTILFFVVIYIVGIIAIGLIGEYYLKKYPPVNSIDYIG